MFSGIVGFMLIEDYSFFDAFYMTVITVSTVGFNEVQTLTMGGKIFTSFLIITSFGTFAYALTSITKYIVGGEYRAYFKDYKMNMEIEKLFLIHTDLWATIMTFLVRNFSSWHMCRS